MEGRIPAVRRTRKAHMQGAGSRGRATTIRVMFGAAVGVITAALLASMVMLVTAAVADLGVASADAAKCRWAHRGPRHVSPSHARHAVICQINKKRRKHGLKAVDTKYALRKAGRRHSTYMQRHNCFAHQCAGERDLVGGSMPPVTCPATAPGEWVRRSPGERGDSGRRGRSSKRGCTATPIAT